MKKIAVFLMALVLIFSLSSCGVKKFSDTGFYLDTVVTLTVYDEDNSSIEKAFSEIQRLESLLSITIPESDVNRVNNDTGWVEVSPEMQEIVANALDYSSITDGAFDITIAPLIELWNVNDGGPVPSDAEINEKLAMADFSKIKMENGSIYAENSLMINLGGVAKGYIADEICELMKSEGVEHGLVNLGGNVAAFGGNANGEDYTIGIRDPFGTETDIIGTVSISNGSVVTSGGYERFFVEDEKIYHHILDPKTGYPAESGLSSVTIVAESSCMADALSTAVYVLGAEKGLELIESLENVECLLVDNYGDLIFSSGMEAIFTKY